MVKSFNFTKFPGIIFGCGRVGELPGIIKGFGTAIVLVTGKNSFLPSTYGQKLLDSLADNRISYKHIIVPGEPSPLLIDTAVRECADEKFSSVVAIGGGSVIDAGKAISAMMYKTGSLTDYLEVVGHKEHPGTKLPFIAVPTTSGTGSEATKNAVISEVGKEGFKRSLRHDNIVPDIALVDPELTLSCTPEITAASGMDCFTQLTEAYISDKSNQYTDALAIEGLRSVRDSLVRSYIDGGNIEARTGMSFAALTSGICLANAGLGVVHGFASSLGGMYNIPHGLVCGTLMASSNKINVRELRKRDVNNVALKKYSVLGEIFIEEKGKTEDYYIDGFIQYLHDLTIDLKLPDLKIIGLEEQDLELICSKTESKNNPVKLSLEDLVEILQNRI